VPKLKNDPLWIHHRAIKQWLQNTSHDAPQVVFFVAGGLTLKKT